MKKIYKKILIFIGSVAAAALPLLVLAANPALDKLKEVAADKGPYRDGGDEAVLVLVQIIINAFLSVIGVLLLVYILYAGYNWLTAQGEEEKVTKAKETIKRVIIGAIIIIAAYAISTFVITKIESGTLKGGDATPKGGTAEP